jgi:hypothetical protein
VIVRRLIAKPGTAIGAVADFRVRSWQGKSYFASLWSKPELNRWSPQCAPKRLRWLKLSFLAKSLATLKNAR